MKTREEIIDSIIERISEEIDDFNFEEVIAGDGETTYIEVRGSREAEGYVDDDYFTGTGAEVTTYDHTTISYIDAVVLDDEEGDVKIDYQIAPEEIEALMNAR